MVLPGSPVSLIVCNLYMGSFRRCTLESATHPPCWWTRYVDDTYTVLVTAHEQEFIDHQNSIDNDIKWMTEMEGIINTTKYILTVITKYHVYSHNLFLMAKESQKFRLVKFPSDGGFSYRLNMALDKANTCSCNF